MILTKKLKNLTFLVLALGISHANADDSWRKEFGDLSARGEFDEALELLNQPELADDLEAAQHRGFLYGSGQLSKGVDRCAAVFNLETAYEAGFYFVRGALDYLYGGDWAGIAALEGSRSALLIVGQRIYESDGRSNPFLAFDEKRSKRDAYPFLYNAAQLGSPEAMRHPLIVPDAAVELGIGDSEKRIEFRKIICAVRK